MIIEKTLKKLEFDVVLTQISQYAKSTLAKQSVLEIKPAESFDNAVFLIDELKQAYDLYDFYSDFDFAIDDITEIANKARVLSTLSMGQLLTVMRSLKTARNLQNSLLKDYPVDTDILKNFAGTMYTNQGLEEEIDFAILSEIEMNDKASNELFEIRRKIKNINADIKRKLESYTKQSEMSKYLQDSLVTIRGDRFVIPVKAEFKSYVGGIVHDQSGSGSTVFIEPMAVVELNNDLRNALLEEQEEIQRILRSFTERISPIAQYLISTQETIVRFDVLFSKVRYALDTRANMPILNQKGKIDIKKARHPLLDKKKVVPTSINLGDKFDIVVVTGPNTGGKTVALKTTGLVTLMAMSGLFVPADENTTVAYFKKIFCDIGDEQSIEQNLSTFSSHITNLRDILAQCDSNTLVLVDEVGAGTEPNEGAALALAITEFLRNSGAKCVITTHYSQLKEYSLATERIENASMEFDINTFSPTYRLVVGVPGSSNALAIAKKLGLQSEIIDYAKNNISAESKNFEKVLLGAEVLRQESEKQLELVAEEKQKLALELKRTQELNSSLSKEREKLLGGAKAEAKRIVKDAELQSKELIAEIKDILNRTDLEEKHIFEARSKAKQLQNLKYQDDENDFDEVLFTGDKIDFSKLKVGDLVFSEKLNTQATVTSIKNINKIDIQAGALSTTVKADDLHIAVLENTKNVNNKTRKQRIGTKNNVNAKSETVVRSSQNEINVIGQTVYEATENIDIFLDGVILTGFKTVWIVHGKGTGRLRQGIQEHLRRHPAVQSTRLGKFGEGEDGVTVVTLK